MLKWLLHRKLRSFERANQYDAAYMHELVDTDPRAFFTFARAIKLNAYRKDVPPAVYAAAGLTSSVAADCGPCTQLGVQFALAGGVPASTLTAILEGDVGALSPDVALGVRFARAVLSRDHEADDLRAEITGRWGPRAVLTLAYAVMAAQLYPALKYAMGHGKACTRVIVGDKAVTPLRRLVAGAA